jgi:hypothetical protein
LQKFIEFYTHYLVRKQTPEDIVRHHPHLSGVWTGPLLTQFGRPLNYFQQVNEINFAAAWEKVTVPVLVFCGEYDWVMSRADHELIARIVNSKHPGRARTVVHPKADHHFLTYGTPQMAFDEAGGRWDPKIPQEMTDWLRLQLKQ